MITWHIHDVSLDDDDPRIIWVCVLYPDTEEVAIDEEGNTETRTITREVWLTMDGVGKTPDDLLDFVMIEMQAISENNVLDIMACKSLRNIDHSTT